MGEMDSVPKFDKADSCPQLSALSNFGTICEFLVVGSHGSFHCVELPELQCPFKKISLDPQLS